MTTPKEDRTDSDIPVERGYLASDGPRHPEEPGQFPFTRGIYSDMYRGRSWTMRQYAGFGTAASSAPPPPVSPLGGSVNNYTV